ncbi:neo-calmodulin-like [Mercenaria mercenaria]|uniref:neo-calmodulin-like n=1 Tax=Mercenaria mercenaria TaxID=6596 RepID=UPI001E1E0495|nr:neo-calmodulin-like [Mercenaria mercenaria]
MDQEEWFELFNRFDKNQDGVIECYELKPFLNYLGFNPTDDEMNFYMELLDKNGDEYIDFEEFYEFARTLPDPVGELREAFTVFDKNKDGYLDEKEMKEVFTSGNFDPNQIDDLFKLVDVNGDGKIDYEEFVALFTQTFHDQDQQCAK